MKLLFSCNRCNTERGLWQAQKWATCGTQVAPGSPLLGDQAIADYSAASAARPDTEGSPRMFLHLAVAAGFALLGVSSAWAQALPVDVSMRVGRAGEFVYSYTPSQYLNRLTDRDVYWSNQPTNSQGGYDKLHFPNGTFSGAYVPVNRVPSSPQIYGRTRVITACGRPEGGGCDLNWL